MSELKPCPFCGKRAMKTKHQDYANPSIFTYGVSCMGCEIKTNPWHETEQEAVDVWNGRANEATWIRHDPDPEAMEAFHKMGIGKGMGVNSIYWTCSRCGCWGTPHQNFCPNCGARMKGGEQE